MSATNLIEKRVHPFPKGGCRRLLHIVLQIIACNALAGVEVTLAAQNYATDLCDVHNRFSVRVACTEVAGVLLSSGVRSQTRASLLRSLAEGDDRKAVTIVDGLDVSSVPVRAAAEYIRGVVFQLHHSGQAKVSLGTACSLAPDQEKCCFAYAVELLVTTKYKESRAVFERLLENAERRQEAEKDSLFQGRVLLCLSSLAWRYGDHPNASNYLNRAAEIGRTAQSNDDDARRRFYAVLGSQYLVQKRYSDAARVYRETLKLDRILAVKYPRSYEIKLADDLDGLARVYRETGNRAQAEHLLQQSVELYSNVARKDPGVGDMGWSTAVRDYAELYAEQQPERSEQIYQRAIDLMRPPAKKMPEEYEPDLEDTLDEMYKHYSNQELWPEAREIAEERYSIIAVLNRTGLI